LALNYNPKPQAFQDLLAGLFCLLGVKYFYDRVQNEIESLDLSGYGGLAFYYFTKKQSNQIKKVFGDMKRGWGSLPVTVTIGSTSWKTSIFPDSKLGVYLLPVKSEIRKKENIVAEKTIIFKISIRI
jgi:hypothetical protein